MTGFWRRAAVQPKEFILANVLTLGIYNIYWGWQLWEIVRRQEGAKYKIRSSIRGIFLPFTGIELFPRLKKYDVKITKAKWPLSGEGLAVLYLLFTIVTRLIGTTTLLQCLVFVALTLAIEIALLMPVVKAVGRLAEANKSFMPPAKTNTPLVVFLCFVAVLTVLGIISIINDPTLIEGY